MKIYHSISGKADFESRWVALRGFETHEVMVYSAYYDVRNTEKPIIRVIGISRAKHPEKVTCRLYYEHRKNNLKDKLKLTHNNIIKDYIINNVIVGSFWDVPGQVRVMEEYTTNSSLYHPCQIKCLLYDHKTRKLKNGVIPVSVSIIPYLSSTITHNYKLPVINSKNGGTGTYRATKNEVGLCVKPVHTNYDDWLQLVSFIEFNKILGVSKIIIYNESISERINCVLKYYNEKENFVSVLAWNVFTESNISIANMRNRGVLASLNDCFYRNMNEYQYLFSVDLDEFIVPHMHNTIPEMLEYLQSTEIEYLERYWRQENVMNNVQNTSNPNITTSYNFLNSFFYQQYGKRLMVF